MYSPSPLTELPFFHGDKYKPFPAGTTLNDPSPRFKYSAAPNALDTPVLANPVNAPVARAGSAVLSKNGATVLPKNSRSDGKKNYPSCCVLVGLCSI